MWRNNHTFSLKIPIVTTQEKDITNIFPQDGFIRCVLLREWIDDLGRRIISVSTEKPDHVESVNEVSKFDLLFDQVTQ